MMTSGTMMTVAMVLLCLIFGTASRIRTNEVQEVMDGGQEHWKYAAVGKDLEDFVRNVEKNREVFHAHSLLEYNASLVQNGYKYATFCPEKWRDRVENKGVFVGGGAFGKVYVAKVDCSPTPATVAIKVQKKDAETLAEARLMQELDHPNLVKAFDHEDGPGAGKLSLLMEAAGGGTFEKIASLSKTEKARLIYEALEGVSALHDKGLVHSDLKPENILLSSNCRESKCHSKLADFGLTIQENGRHYIAGSPLWMAPEMIRSHRPRKSNDMWSMGVVVFEILKGERPRFLQNARTVEGLMLSITNQRKGYTPQDSSLGEKLLKGLLQPDPVWRDTARQAADVAKEWWQSLSRGAYEDMGRPRLPVCWYSCRTAGCAAKKKNCYQRSIDDGAVCIGSAADAGPQNNRLIEITIRNRLVGPLGFTTDTGNHGLVTKVHAGSRAAWAGLRVNDVIKEIQGVPWTSLTMDKRQEIIRFASAVTLGIVRR